MSWRWTKEIPCESFTTTPPNAAMHQPRQHQPLTTMYRESLSYIHIPSARLLVSIRNGKDGHRHGCTLSPQPASLHGSACMHRIALSRSHERTYVCMKRWLWHDPASQPASRLPISPPPRGGGQLAGRPMHGDASMLRESWVRKAPYPSMHSDGMGSCHPATLLIAFAPAHMNASLSPHPSRVPTCQRLID